MLFCSGIQYIVRKKQSVGSAHEVLPGSLKPVFEDEVHFIANLHNFLQPLGSPLRHPFTPNEPFVPHSSSQKHFQNSFLLGAS